MNDLTQNEKQEMNDIRTILTNIGGVQADSQMRQLQHRWADLNAKIPIRFLRADGIWTNIPPTGITFD